VSQLDFEKIRRAERAKIDRWFTVDPAGTVFHTGDGRALWIRVTDAERWRDKAYAIVDDANEVMRDAAKIAGGLAVVGVVALSILLMKTSYQPNGSEELLVMLVAGAWPAWTTYRYYQTLYELRAEITRSLAIGVPLPRDFAAATPRRNTYRTVLATIAPMLLAVLVIAHIYPHIIEMIPAAAYIAIVPIAWALHFAAQAVDRKG